jgi:phage protein U
MAINPLDPADIFQGASPFTFATGFIPQMVFGDFLFSLNTAAYQSLSRKSSYRWAAAERIGKTEFLQFMGPNAQTVSLAGEIVTTYRGGVGQIDRLRDIASEGKPQVLMQGTGDVFGRWVILSIDDEQTEIAPFGLPRQQAFTIELKYYDGVRRSLLLEFLRSLV